MEIVSSNKTCSMIIAGILITSIIAILMAFTLGVGGTIVYSDKGIQPVNTGVSPLLGANNSTEQLRSEPLGDTNMIHSFFETSGFKNLEEYQSETSGNYETVSIPQSCDNCGGVPVEHGIIKFNDLEVDDPLPYNIEQSDLANWNITAEVYGNYELKTSVVYVWQQHNGHRDDLDGAMLLIDWSEVSSVSHWPLPPCRPDKWKGTFKLYYCNNPILAHSSYMPDVILCDGTQVPSSGQFIDPNDHKLVYFDIDTTVEGCHDFVVILSHKNHVSGIPNSRINI